MKISNSRKSAIGSAAALACGLLGITVANAARVPTVEICHWNTVANVYTKIAIPGGVPLDKHLENHGDIYPDYTDASGIGVDENCNVVERKVFARAFVDVNPGDGPYNSDVDIDIAVLSDDNGNQILDSDGGDRLTVYQYPTSFTPCSTGVCTDILAFTGETKNTTVAVSPPRTDGVVVWLENSERFNFTSNHSAGSYIIGDEIVLGGFDPFTGEELPPNLAISDITSGAGPDRLNLSQPRYSSFEWEFPLQQDSYSAQDDGFIDVELYFP